MTTYDSIIEEIRDQLKSFRERAKSYIPRLAEALKAEGLDDADARDRIEKDCVEFWAIMTIRHNLPQYLKDSAKDGSKQRRYSKKEEPSEPDAPEITTTGETYKGDAGNNPDMLSNYVLSESDAQALSEKLGEIKPEAPTVIATTNAIVDDRDAKIKELQEMIATLSKAQPNTKKLLDAQMKAEELEQKVAELEKAIESQPLRTAKEQIGEQWSATIPASKLGQVILACQKAARSNKGIKIAGVGNELREVGVSE